VRKPERSLDFYRTVKGVRTVPKHGADIVSNHNSSFGGTHV